MLINPGYNGPSEIKYLFVDGACLRETIRALSDRYFLQSLIELDYNKVASGYTKVFYYDAIPVKEACESDESYQARIHPQEELLSRIRLFDRYHVYEGDARRRGKRGLEQKKVDVMIAVDMLTHSFRRNMHKAALLTGDLDFKPLIDALVQEGMFVTLWYPKGATSKELIAAADARTEFGIQMVFNCATEAYRARFSLPNTLSRRRDTEDGVLLTSWRDEAKGLIELYKIDMSKEYLLVFLEGLNPGYYIHVRHTDLHLIKLFAEDVYGVKVNIEV